MGSMAMLTGKEITVILACYFLGCFAAGYYWVRWRAGLDIREHGSGSVGARNVGRILGPFGFVVTLLLDVTKGALAVAAAMHFGLRPEPMVAAMLAVVVGHAWPFQLRFQGGKGVATSLGALAAYDPFILLSVFIVFLPAFVLLRNFTLSGLLAFAISPLIVFLSGLGNVEVATISFLAILILITHRKNIREEMTRRLPDRREKSSVRTHKGTGS
jgi:acyl phosphate:glycerol-3-phosphate acyltransferase